jgi:hypothetical protein
MKSACHMLDFTPIRKWTLVDTINRSSDSVAAKNSDSEEKNDVGNLEKLLDLVRLDIN